MRAIKFASPVLLLMLLAGQLMLLPSQVSAQDCCGCGNCWMREVYGWNCICNEWGIDPNCGYCVEDADVFQSNTSTDEGTADQSSVPGNLVSTVAKSNVTERVMELMSGGKCFREKVALSLLGNARDGLKLEPVRFYEKKAQNQTLAF